jgi:hypothetical protein
MKRSTRAVRDLGARDAYFEGLILASSGLQSGEAFTVGGETFLVHTVHADHASDELSWYGAKANVFVTHKRHTETVDAYGNIIQTWTTLAVDVPAFGEVVTYAMRQADPGLLEGTRYLLQLAKSMNVQLLDRFVYQGGNYQVNSINDIGLPGIALIQLGVDTRP